MIAALDFIKRNHHYVFPAMEIPGFIKNTKTSIIEFKSGDRTLTFNKFKIVDIIKSLYSHLGLEYLDIAKLSEIINIPPMEYTPTDGYTLTNGILSLSLFYDIIDDPFFIAILYINLFMIEGKDNEIVFIDPTYLEAYLNSLPESETVILMPGCH